MAKKKKKKATTKQTYRTTAARFAYRYPNADDLPTVLEAGGLSRLPEDERNAIKARSVVLEPGASCAGVPPIVLEAWIRIGWAAPVKRSKKKKRGAAK